MKQTRIRFLLLLALLAGVLGWVVAQIWPVLSGQELIVPMIAPISMWMFTLTLVAWSASLWRRLPPKVSYVLVDPHITMRSAALALTSSRIGALVFGFYFGIFLYNLLLLNSSASKVCIKLSIATALAGCLLVVVALWLEKICRIDATSNDVEQSPN